MGRSVGLPNVVSVRLVFTSLEWLILPANGGLGLIARLVPGNDLMQLTDQ
jgi:hypothetical protein